ncbi:MAG TPA: precorrin-2 C(20)-methyltransferase [Nitrososphaeraceae archaeon]|nr:precorrin-2 C(20)-methyltransferase [Nitrososphaeraceae archaeon]
MKLSCIGCGPGDPELLTIKAVKLIKSAEVIFAPTAKEGKPSIALSIVKKYISSYTKTINLIFPMLKDKQVLNGYWKENTEKIANEVRAGKKVIYLTVGDPSIYSTWIHIYKELRRSYKDIKIDIIPGITSIFAFAAEAKIALVEGDETLAIVPACYDMERVRRTSNVCDTVIFLKDGRHFDDVIDMLPEAGFVGDSMIAIAQDVAVEGEVIKMSRLTDFRGRRGSTEKYFSIMVAKKKSDRE